LLRSHEVSFDRSDSALALLTYC